MARYTGPVCRLCRREGLKLYLKGDRCYTDKCSIGRRNYAPGQHGQNNKKLSNYGIQLREKQKVKRTYGLREKKMKIAYKEANRRSKLYDSDKGLELLRILELRLDNIVYLSGLAPSRAAARQFVTHGHVKLNGEKSTIPSFEVKEGDSIELSKAKLAPAEKLFQTPDWIERKDLKSKIARMPMRDDIDEGIKENLIIEFYSK